MTSKPLDTALDTSSLDDVPVAMVVTDPNLPDNPIIYVNDAFTELTGYTREASVGRNCRFLQGADTDPTARKELREAIAAGEPVALEIVNERADGRVFINNLAISPIRATAPGGEGEGPVEFFLGIQSADLGRDRFGGRGRGGDDHGGGGDLTARLSDRLQALQDRVRDQVGFVLTTVREVAGGAGDPLEANAQVASRLESLAQLYEGVFRRDVGPGPEGDGDRVRLGSYLSRVCSATLVAHPGHNIRLNTRFRETECDIETAARVGLVLGELLHAALGATHRDPRAAIRVSLSEDGPDASLGVEVASGRALPTLLPDMDTLGGRLLAAVVPKLDARTRSERTDGGSVVRVTVPGIRFPENAPELSG